MPTNPARYDDAFPARYGEALAKVHAYQSAASLLLDGRAPFLPLAKKLPQPETLDELGLGRGNRMLVKGGRLDAKYMITVPEDMWTQPAPYYRQVRLLTRILPIVAQETCFALKGGTAINLFVRDLPRLSVDIDLVYLPMDDRETALKNIAAALGRIADSIKKRCLRANSYGRSRTCRRTQAVR